MLVDFGYSWPGFFVKCCQFGVRIYAGDIADIHPLPTFPFPLALCTCFVYLHTFITTFTFTPKRCLYLTVPRQSQLSFKVTTHTSQSSHLNQRLSTCKQINKWLWFICIRSKKIGSTWQWCLIVCSCGYSRWPCWWGQQASSSRHPRSTTTECLLTSTSTSTLPRP